MKLFPPKPRYGRFLAVPLRVFDFGETSQVVHLYVRDLGKIHAIAKGAKRRKGPFRGPFDLLRVCEIIRLEKQPGTLDLLTGMETLREFLKLRADYARFCAASYLLELVAEATPEAQPHPRLYDALVRGLEELDGGRPVAESVFRFEAALLDELGHFPRLDACGACRLGPSGSEVWFSPRDGGVFCRGCPPRDVNRLLVKRVALDGLEAYREGREFSPTIYPGFVADLRKVIDTHLRVVLERDLKSAKQLRDCLIP